MPTDYIRKLAHEGKGSVEELERKWGEAKEAAKEGGKGDNFAVVTTIFKNMVGASVLNAKARLQATERLAAMPQIVPIEHESPWFDEFYRLKKAKELFTFNGYEVGLYQQPMETNPSYFVALDNQGKPAYVNEVFKVTTSCTDPAVAEQLKRFDNLYMQSSVSYAKDADRSKLKGLATKVFWDYLASNGNAAITDSQQSVSGMNFWKKLYQPSCMYLVVQVAANYRDDRVVIEKGNTSFEAAAHLSYNVPPIWRESPEGRLVRLIISKLK